MLAQVPMPSPDPAWNAMTASGLVAFAFVFMFFALGWVLTKKLGSIELAIRQGTRIHTAAILSLHQLMVKHDYTTRGFSDQDQAAVAKEVYVETIAKIRELELMLLNNQETA